MCGLKECTVKIIVKDVSKRDQKRSKDGEAIAKQWAEKAL